MAEKKIGEVMKFFSKPSVARGKDNGRGNKSWATA